MVENQFKRNDMIVLLYCFIQNTTNSHLRMLTKIKEKIGVTKKDAYFPVSYTHLTLPTKRIV